MSHQSLRTVTPKIIVAMSGGLDSSVTAALLKRAGFNITGVFMKFWQAPSANGKDRWNRCCSPEAEKRARFVASHLKIPFYVLNFEKEFKKKIVDYFLKEYKAGRTPNPCVVCNRDIKFGLLLDKALGLKTHLIATGHYACSKEGRLFKGKDKEKDQSYFLWQLSSKKLERTLFPLCGYTKKEVRKLAKDFKLPLGSISESQEICFVQTTTNDFLSRYIKKKPGKIVDSTGKVVGSHQGLFFYTIGQRKGLLLSGGPFWVKDKDFKRNLLIVTKKEKDLLKKELMVKNVNWLSGKAPKLPLKVKAKIRYRHKAASATIHKSKAKEYKVVFNKPQRAITPGQSAVFYKGQELLGGGIISRR